MGKYVIYGNNLVNEKKKVSKRREIISSERTPSGKAFLLHIAALFTGFGAMCALEEIASEGVGLLVFLLTLIGCVPMVVFACLYRREKDKQGETKFLFLLFTTLSVIAAIFILLIVVFMGGHSIVERYAMLFFGALAAPIPMLFYGYICYFFCDKNKKQSKMMFLVDKVGVYIHAIVIVWNILCICIMMYSL